MVKQRVLGVYQVGDGANSNPVGQLAVRGGAGSRVRRRDPHDPKEVTAPINPYRSPDARDDPMRSNTGKKANHALRALFVFPLMVIGVTTIPVGIGFVILIATHFVDRWLLKGPRFFSSRIG